MQLLGTIAGCEINSIATSEHAPPTAFVTAGSDGFVRYWDTRMRKKDVLGFAVPNSMGDTDLLEVVWGVGAGAASADLSKAYTIAGSVLSCVDVRKADVVSQHFFTNTFRVRSKHNNGVDSTGAAVYETRAVPVALASFDAALKQHPSATSSALSSAVSEGPHALRVCDDEGEVYVVDPLTCKPITSSSSSAPPAAYCGLLRPKPSKTVSSGFSSFFHNPNLATQKAAPFAAAPRVSTLVCGMDNSVLCYGYGGGSSAAAASTAAGVAVGCVGGGAAVDMVTALKGSKLAAALSLEDDGEEGGATAALLGRADHASKAGANAVVGAKRQEIANPPIPTCFAPLVTSDRDGMQLAAIGRGDGSFVILDVAPQHSSAEAEEEEVNEGGEVTAASMSPIVEVAFVGQGHAHNTIGTCLWVPPHIVASTSSSSSSACAPKLLVTIPTSGEVTLWDITKSVMPIAEGDEEGECEEDNCDPIPLYASEVRGAGLAGARSLVNCGALLASGRGLLVGTSGGEVLTDVFDL